MQARKRCEEARASQKMCPCPGKLWMDWVAFTNPHASGISRCERSMQEFISSTIAPGRAFSSSRKPFVLQPRRAQTLCHPWGGKWGVDCLCTYWKKACASGWSMAVEASNERGWSSQSMQS